MKLVGFNFTKINVEKFLDSVENLKINTQIDISEIKQAEAHMLKMKEDILGIGFKYTIGYDPGMANIVLEGKVLLAIDPTLVKEILKEWKDKKIPPEFKLVLFNVILRKTNVRALQLEEEMSLPLHVSMPSLKKQEDDPQKKKE